MNIPATPDELLSSLPPLRDNNLSAICFYPVNIAEAHHSDAAFAYRITELFMLSLSAPLSEKLFALTGIHFPPSRFTHEEAERLLTRCNSLYQQAEEETVLTLRQVESAKFDVRRASGRAETLAEAQSRRSGAIRAEAEIKQRSAESALHTRQQQAETIGMLTGMLRQAARAFLPDYRNPHLDRAELISRMPARLLSADVHSEPLIRACSDAHNDIKNLQKAAQEICNNCAPPADRYELSNGGLERAEAWRLYYRPENRLLQALCTPQEYVSWRSALIKKTASKNRLFKTASGATE